ncbi:MAG TPA: DUF3180 domain-containing protein [Stackebrandtia sp.]|jgi:hypothetical protein|uniref:DUF3180 domain-containing protein n=1 Tax=Stackebrandtia sp. TaxID=2023065 RepID=UPI002D7520FB|nr:DUF3180 domain-containing protein [Stackebrandtia sp.]HZE40934.1 DUF3180 domain-containing protein [Stackebrandtia sp.]
MADKDTPPQPSLKPTAPSTLFVSALATGALMLLLASRTYPPVPRWYTPAFLAVLALALAYTAHTTKARIARKPGTRPVEPLVFARFAALAKASSIGGALIAGAYAGLLIYLVAHRDSLKAAAGDLPNAAFGFAASLLLVAAGLWLERACRVPDDEDEDDHPDGASTANG